MKQKILIAVAALGALVAFGAGDDSKLPATVRRIDRLKDAQADAKQQKKAVAFVMSEVKKGGNKLVLEATQQVFTKLRGQCVFVYINFFSERGKLAKALPKINEAFDSEDLKKSPIPRTVVTDPNGEKIYALIPYIPEGKLGEEMFKEARQKIADALAGKASGDDVTVAGGKAREIAPPPPVKKDKNQQ